MTGLQRTLAVVSLVAAVALGVLLLRHPSEAQALPRPFTVMRAGQYFGTRTTVPGRSLMVRVPRVSCVRKRVAAVQPIVCRMARLVWLTEAGSVHVLRCGWDTVRRPASRGLAATSWIS